MTDFRFESEKIEDPEVVSEFSMEDYEKYRLKTSELTIDLAIVDLENRNKDEYINGRKEELNDSQTEVPHPYKPEKQNEDAGKGLVEFNEDSIGKGFADPEYNLIAEDEEEIIRYIYAVMWQHFQCENKLAEIEVYAPRNSDLDIDDILRIAESLKI